MLKPIIFTRLIIMRMRVFETGNGRWAGLESSCCAVVLMARVKELAPCWSGTAVLDGDFQELSSQQYHGKYLVLFFYPNDFTFVCPTELLQLSEKIPAFDKINCAVVACSCDSQYSHLAWCQTEQRRGGLGEVAFPILADPSHKIAGDYGVLVESQGVALRGTFIIDTKGIVRSATVNDMEVGRNIDEILRLVQAFQFTDLHGEVCPEGWRPGEKSVSMGIT
jgi:alkyl hydroperoxide reductase subunit AhpC